MLTQQEAYDYTTVKRAIRACCPFLPVFNIKANHGYQNYTYFVNRDLVVRFFRDPYIEKSIVNVSNALDYLAPRLPLPIGTFRVCYGEWRGQPLMMTLSERIKGHPIPEQAVSHLSPEKKRYLFDQLSAFLSVFHAFSRTEMAQFNLPSSEERMINMLQKTDAAKLAPIARQTYRIIRSKDMLCHNDLHSRNFHINASYQIQGFFDFDTIGFGNPVWDIVRLSFSYRDATAFKTAYELQTNERLSQFKMAYLIHYASRGTQKRFRERNRQRQ